MSLSDRLHTIAHEAFINDEERADIREAATQLEGLADLVERWVRGGAYEPLIADEDSFRKRKRN